MRKLLAIFSIAALFFVSCGGSQEAPEESAELEDGYYFAMGERFGNSGWRDAVFFTVRNGQITEATWDGANIEAGDLKSVQSIDGRYGMMEGSDAQSPWFEQAANMEAWLVETQNGTEGQSADAVTGVSINTSGFSGLVAAALEAGPVERGALRDGAYRAQAGDFGGSGWRDFVELTVVGGRIAAVRWDGEDEEGRMKYETSVSGEYGMVANSDAQSEWHVQADAAEAWVVANQNIGTGGVSFGSTDAITGVSISSGGFFGLIEQALADGPI